MRHELHERILRRTSHLLEQNKRLAALNAIATSVNRSLDVHHTLHTALEQALHFMDLEAGAILVRDSHSETFRLHVHRGFPEGAPVLSLLGLR